MSANFRSLNEIAKHYGRAKSAVHKWTQHADWPCAKGEYDRAKIDAFFRQHIQKQHETVGPPIETDDPHEILKLVTSPTKRLQLQGAVERMLKTRAEREFMLGGWLKKEDVEAGRVARIQAVRAELANIRLLALKLDGKPVSEMEQVLEDWAKGVCQKFERSE